MNAAAAGALAASSTIQGNDPVAQALTLATVHGHGANRRPPGSKASTTSLRKALDMPLPEVGRDATAVLRDLATAATPGLMGNTGPDFYGWVMGASSPVGMAADILTTIWGQNAAIYQTAPSAAIAEEVTSRWLLELLDLPRESSVGFVTGATMANFVGLAAARSESLRRHGWDIETNGLHGAPPIQIFVGKEAHTSILSVLRYLGFGKRSLVTIPADKQGRLQAQALARSLEAHTGPKIIIAQAGHINSGACDPMERIGELARQHDAWFHVDGAFGLWARTAPGLRQYCRGAELADSWAVDGHKWLQIPYDCGYAILRDGDAHRRVMSMNASYLNRDPLDGRNPSDYVPELSRRARGFTTWACLQALGKRGVAQMVERHCACARRLAARVGAEPGVLIRNDVVLNQVAISFAGAPMGSAAHTISGDELTDAVISRIQRDNSVFVSGADWRGQRILRISVISRSTELSDIDRLAGSILRAWREVRARGPAFQR